MDNLPFIILHMVISFASLLFFIRFMLQLAEITPRNTPIMAPAYQTTKIVDIFARIFPPLAKGRFCTSAVMLIFLLRLIEGSFQHNLGAIQLFFASTVTLILDFLNACHYLILASIITSWITVFTNNSHPLIELIQRVTEPILAPFRRITPDLGMIDLSPMLAFFGIFLLEILIKGVVNNMWPML